MENIDIPALLETYLTAAEVAIALDLSVGSVNAYVWQARRQIILALGEG